MMKILQPTIGILAGMGPKSTAPFIDQIINQYQETTGAIHDIDFPPLIAYSLPTPFYLDKAIDHALMEETICSGLKRLSKCDVSFISIPCITAHLYFDSLKKCTTVPLLNMIDATLQEIPPSTRRVAILATRTTMETSLLQNNLRKMGHEVISQNSWQNKINELILAIKMGKAQAQWTSLWDSLSCELQAAHVDTLLLACTDLNVFFNNSKQPFQVVDASLCLAKAVVNKWLETNQPSTHQKF